MKIEEVNNSNLHLVNKIDSTFTVTSKLKISLSGKIFSYETEPVSPYRKSYEYEPIDYSIYIKSSERIIFFAFEEEQLTGQIILLKYWNGYCYINDIRVEKSFRGKKTGTALIAKAVEWAKENDCIGLEAETQDVNVDACKFYAKLGFTLGGADFFRYKSSEKEKNETALNWYFLL